MAREEANPPSGKACEQVHLGAAEVGEPAAPALLRWTLGNLDEAFRSCIAQLETLGDLDFAVGGRASAGERGLAHDDGRFRSCDSRFRSCDSRFRSCDGPIERDASLAPRGEGAGRSDLADGPGRA
jgi:hypothetical protein